MARGDNAAAEVRRGRLMPTPNDFSNFQFGQDKSAERQESNLGTGGDFGQVSNAPATPEVPADSYPNVFNYASDPQNREFSGDKSETPGQMAGETSNSQSAFTELQQYLNNSLDTRGCRVAHPISKPWTPPHGADGE
jgi:hypothetical protein